jgi:hypothetical protein
MFKKLLILLSIAIVGGFATGFYYWRQFTTLPDWYQSQESEQMIAQIKQNSDEQKSSTGKDITLQLNREDINRILVKKVAENSQYSHLLRSAKSIQANLENNTLEIGGVFNPSQIPQESLDETQKAILDQTLQNFPQLKNLDIYVGVVSQPKVENGRLILDKNSTLKIGKLSFTIDEFASKFGIAPEKLQQYLEVEVAQLNIQGLKIDNDKMTIEISQ